MRLDRPSSIISPLALGPGATRRGRALLRCYVVALCALVGVSLSSTPAAAQTCTIQWAGPATGGNWNAASSWSPARLPTSTDVACTGPADVTVSLVSLNGAGVAQHLLAGGNITIGSGGRLTLGQGGTIAGNLAFTSASASLVNQGPLTVGGHISATLGGEIYGVGAINALGFSLASQLTIRNTVVSVTGVSTLTAVTGALSIPDSTLTIQPTATFELGNGIGMAARRGEHRSSSTVA